MPRGEQQNAGLVAALRRFPADRKTIEKLILRDSDFRDMCDDLAIWEKALSEAEQLSIALREERVADWAASIDQSVFEIARALREEKVVHVGWGIQRKRR